MKAVGIVAEYNPFHLGHQKQISFVRESLHADYIIAVMSGDFVQRGTPALLSKHVRTEAALRCGIDLVLELPVSVSSASAEFFAEGSVEILDRIGVTDSLCFGSEEGELPLFLKTAEILIQEPPEYTERLKSELKLGASFPAARCKALTEYAEASDPNLPREAYDRFLAEPNNILGIEYCKALLRRNSRIQPVTLRREGAGYHDRALFKGQAPSASGIRHALRSDSDDIRQSLGRMLPEPSLKLLAAAQKENRLVFEEDLDTLLAYCLFSETTESLCQYLDVSPELASRIVRMRNRYTGFLSFASVLKTRELTQTRIQRALLHILLHIKNTPDSVGYARVLGFRKDAAPLLSAIKKEGQIPLLTKAADAPRLLDASSLQVFEQTANASNIYESLLIGKSSRPFLHEYQKPVVIV